MRGLFSGILWKFVEKVLSQMVTFVVSVVLARILLPSEYGIIAKVTIFITIADVLVTTGLASSLIQKKDVSENDFSTMFYVNMVFSLLLYSILFVTAPVIGVFFGDSRLIQVLRVLSGKILLSAYISIQQAYISKYMLFRKSAIVSLFATISSAIVGIVLAYQGCGVWALVWQQLSFAMTQVVLFTVFINWRPRCCFSFSRARSMIGFGNQVLFAGVLDTIGAQIKTVIIGKCYSDNELAYYNRGDLYPQLLISSISGALHTVLFAAYSQEQDRLDAVKEIMRKGVRRGCFVVFAMLVGLACVAHPLVEVMLTSKWLPCVPYLQIACIAYCTWPIQIVQQEAIIGLGYGKDYLMITISRVTFNLVALLALAQQGIIWISVGVIMVSLFSTFLVCKWTKEKLNYRYKEQVEDILPAIVNSVIIFVAVRVVSVFNLPVVIELILGIFAGVIGTVLHSFLTRNETFFWAIYKIKSIKGPYGKEKNHRIESRNKGVKK